MTDSVFLAAARGHAGAHTPVWFMRQAGRSLPEYKTIRGDGSILHAIKDPAVAAEITLQPVRRYGVDAAVLFSDIVVPAHAIGFGIDVSPGTGPVATTPFRRASDLPRVRALEPEIDTPYVVETCRILAAELPPGVPLLAFAGAPFTVASYLIEGRPSRTYEHTKALMHTDEGTWHDLMNRLADHAIASLRSQLNAGAAAFQLFDSWAGALSRSDYERFAMPHSARVFAELQSSHPSAPAIHFGIGCDHILEPMYAAGASVIGLDWRTSISAARARLGPNTVVQGNLDPALVLAGWSVAQQGCNQVLADNGGHPGHIFNLGHGVQPNTDPGVLEHITTYVHQRTARP